MLLGPRRLVAVVFEAGGRLRRVLGGIHRQVGFVVLRGLLDRADVYSNAPAVGVGSASFWGTENCQSESNIRFCPRGRSCLGPLHQNVLTCAERSLATSKARGVVPPHSDPIRCVRMSSRFCGNDFSSMISHRSLIQTCLNAFSS
jgi:hypothetical protein